MDEKTKEIYNRIKLEFDKAFDKNLFDEKEGREKIKEMTKIMMRDFAKDCNFQYKDAFTIICDETNNTEEDIENGVVNATIIPKVKIIDIAIKLNETL